MNKVVITWHGAPEALQVVDTDLPVPVTGEVLVKVSATGIAWADTMARRGPIR
jgi:NADPH:quinone reductase-like Zn-dependent oxidoreductase